MSEQPGKRPVERVVLWPGRCEACHRKVALLAGEDGVIGWLHPNGTVMCVDARKRPLLCDAARERRRLITNERRRRQYRAQHGPAGVVALRIARVLGSQP